MQRDKIKDFREIPNVGAATEKQFITLGLNSPQELAGKDPYQLYSELCKLSQKRLDPCLLDVFISAVHSMQGEPARKWWAFTKERKQHLGKNPL